MTLTPEAAAVAVSRLALMAFFPGDPDTRSAMIWALLQFVETEEQLDWLVARALKLYTRWPGVGEIRALYCSRFKPKDGVESYSEIFDRYPHESPPPPNPKPKPKPGEAVTADVALQKELERVGALKTMPAPKPRRVK